MSPRPQLCEPQIDHGPPPMPGQLLLLPAPESHEPAPTTAAPERGTPCKVIGSGLGLCHFYREHVSATGNRAWLVIDERCNQYHAAHPELVRIMRAKRKTRP